ncbi:MAG: sulfotransferase [Alphaproteobacteria bacterium]|nr:sulfotransferase [Alphaproteobacteria bacterium]MBV9694647.1 sulfotransferase [Alphaproteobacteria bacterium]
MPLGPDFLCIGMHKAGTQWLYDQLQGHPDFWMPPLKEMHYLERDSDIGRNARKVLDQERSTSRPGATRRTPIDARDRAFLEEYASHRALPRDVARYAALFAHKGDRISGDITPQYGELDDALVAEVMTALPDLAIVLLVRDPVARTWSHISQWHRQGRFDRGALDSAQAFRRFLERSARLQKFSSATRVAARWSAHVRPGRFKHLFFDDIAARPQEARREALVFLGADPGKESAGVDAAFNRKKDYKKLELTPELERALAEFLKGELIAGAAMFGGPARQWAAKYGF